MLLSVIALFIYACLYAQDKSTPAKPAQQAVTSQPVRLSFSSINQAGILNGEAGAAFVLQSINGVQYKTWFTGIGVGLDFYEFRGIPVFVDVRKDLLKPGKPYMPFVYVDGGIHFTWPEKKDKKPGYDNTFNNGPWLDAGVGCKVAVKKGHAFLVSAGYSFKHVKYTRTPPFDITEQRPALPEIYDYKLNRLSLKLGWQL